VAVTGLGLLCCLGRGVDTVWPRLLAGEHGFGEVDLPGFEAFGNRMAGQVPAGLFERPDPAPPRRLSRHELFAWAAVTEALGQAGWSAVSYPAHRVGVISGMGSSGLIEAEDWFAGRRAGARMPSRLLRAYPSSALPDVLAAAYRLTGPRFSIATACSSSGTGLGLAADLIRDGSVTAVLVVGSESLSRVTFGGFSSLRAMAPDRCRPFDARRKGIILGEGAAAMILEDMDAARARGAAIHGEVLGWGNASDAHHMTSPLPDGSGLARAMRQALTRSALAPSDIGYGNMHGTGTVQNDTSETEAVKAVFGDHARRLALSSTKSMTGHCLGTAGIIESVFTVMALKTGMAPPTAGLEEPDPACDLDYIPGTARSLPGLRHAVNNVMAFAGNNISLVLRAAPDAP
jgi:3-oxoacyl-[acyl-carrier-protein] synthase II